MSYALNMIIDINCVHIEYNGENGNLPPSKKSETRMD